MGHFKRVENRLGQCLFSYEKNKNLERMNQINQGNELHIIPFFFFKWAPTIIRLFMWLLYMWREK